MISKKRIALFIALGLLGVAAMKVDLFSHPRTDCAFCDGSVLERQEVFRGEFSSILFTHKPAVDGHLLVIPHRHVERYESLTGDEIKEMGELVIKAQSAAHSLFGTDEYLLLQKNGRGVGQTVPHVHIHVIPKKGTMSQLSFTVRFFISSWLKPLDGEQTKILAQQLISALEESAPQDAQAL